jgi:predicted DNA-binding transcriptional regulator YafY
LTKRPDTLETARLAVELMRRIPRGRKVTATELHRQLKDAGIDRDLRTIQRQLDMLSEHFEIERDDRSKPYGYRWLERAAGLAVPSLTPQESLLLGLAEQHLSSLLPARLMKSMEGFFEQARRNLASDGKAHLEREWAKKVRVVATSQPLLPPKVEAGVFAAVSEALYANLWLSLDYGTAAGRRIQAEVMPLGLAQQGQRLYLVGRFKGYDNERSLALHRIISAEVLAQDFARPKDFDLKRYDDDGRFGFSKGQLVRLSFTVTRDAGFHLLESPLSEDQQATEVDGGRLHITCTVVDSSMLDWWLRGFGDDLCEVRRVPVDMQNSNEPAQEAQ